MSLVLSLCATTIPYTNSALCISSSLIIILYIFIDLVIYSSPKTPHTSSHLFFLYYFASTVLYQACLYIKKLTQTVCVKHGSFRTPDIHVAPLCAALRLRADLRAKPPFSHVFEVSVNKKATCHFGQLGDVLDFSFLPPSTLRPCSTGIRENKLFLVIGVSCRVEQQH